MSPDESETIPDGRDAALLAKPEGEWVATLTQEEALQLAALCAPVVVTPDGGVPVVRCAHEWCKRAYPCPEARAGRAVLALGTAYTHLVAEHQEARHVNLGLAIKLTSLREIHVPARPHGALICRNCLALWPCGSAYLIYTHDELARSTEAAPTAPRGPLVGIPGESRADWEARLRDHDRAFYQAQRAEMEGEERPYGDADLREAAEADCNPMGALPGELRGEWQRARMGLPPLEEALAEDARRKVAEGAARAAQNPTHLRLGGEHDGPTPRPGAVNWDNYAYAREHPGIGPDDFGGSDFPANLPVPVTGDQ